MPSRPSLGDALRSVQVARNVPGRGVQPDGHHDVEARDDDQREDVIDEGLGDDAELYVRLLLLLLEIVRKGRADQDLGLVRQLDVLDVAEQDRRQGEDPGQDPDEGRAQHRQRSRLETIE